MAVSDQPDHGSAFRCDIENEFKLGTFAHNVSGGMMMSTAAKNTLDWATVRRLLTEDAQVILGDVLVESGELLAKELGAQASFVELDVTSESDWTRAVEHCVETYGSPSILVSNAGIMCVKPIEQSTAEDFRRTFEVNAIGAFLGIRAVVPLMRANGGGSITTMSSTAGSIGVEGLTAYCASKAANFTIARCAAMEFGRDNIRVNAVNPGGIDTAMSRSDAVAAIDADELYAGLPLARIGKVDEVVALIAFLASDDATFITGGQHVIDGGLLAGQMMS
jgi:3alpha(or 20beta)-hydroxysteroid dehydrogenase